MKTIIFSILSLFIMSTSVAMASSENLESDLKEVLPPSVKAPSGSDVSRM